MKTRRVVIGEVCKLNLEVINSSNPPKIIKYLDTSSITRNEIEKIQVLDSDIEPFPSRAQRRVKNGTIIYSTVRPEQEHYGFLENPDNNLIVSTGFLTIDVIDKNIDPKFIYYALTRKDITNYLQTIAVNNVSSYPSITPNNFANLVLEIPLDINIQNKIASFLDMFEYKIKINNKINLQLENLAKTLYKYWFIQFDFPDKNGKPYKISGGKMVWNKELKREIPEGWGVKALKEVINIVRGASPRPIDNYLSTKGVPWVKISDATKSNNRFITETKQFILEVGSSKSRCVIPNTLILSNSASPAIPRIMKIDACVHDGWLVIDEYTCGLTQEFMFEYFENERPRIIYLGSGSIFKNLKTDYLKELKIILPPKSLLDQLSPYLRTISETIYIKTKENQQLSSLRDWLLPMLINGQVIVNTEEKHDEKTLVDQRFNKLNGITKVA